MKLESLPSVSISKVFNHTSFIRGIARDSKTSPTFKISKTSLRFSEPQTILIYRNGKTLQEEESRHHRRSIHNDGVLTKGEEEEPSIERSSGRRQPYRPPTNTPSVSGK
ncbi:hypothetical protein DY000_02022912 [Brassica cretica]|uniref:Uncharacterized protein n=1 Tax=Brassica cretica TaxID=69181 RepID=A0ABQ7EI83_BRACR|nr:hypothetical protein DY000_02022912 [Brassica cretica]